MEKTQIKNEIRWLIPILLVAILVFANSLGGEFTYDDNRQIERNPLIQDASLYGKALTSDVWAFKGDGNLTASNYYRPTFVAWLILNFAVFGSNPFGWHLLNILLHTGVCAMAFLLLRRWNVSPILAFAITLIYGVHPIHTESVAWISGSPDLLFSLTLLSSFWFAENIAQKYTFKDAKNKKVIVNTSLDLVFSLLLFSLALGSKEVGMLCFPLFFLIFAKSMNRQNAIRLTIPFLICSGLFFVARWIALGAISMPVEQGTPLAQAILSVPEMFIFYLRQAVFPFWIGANYPLRPVTGIASVEFILPIIVSTAAIGLLWLLAKRGFIERLGFAIFFLTLLPAMNATVFPTEQIVHDRYLYLPLLGFLMMLLPYLMEILEKYAKEKSRSIFLIVILSISAALAARTLIYNQVWTSNLALWSDAVKVDPQSSLNWLQLGSVLTEKEKTDEAITAYNNSLDIKPSALAYMGQARNFVARNKNEEAVFNAKTVLEMPEDNVNPYALYQTYEILTIALVNQKKYGEAQKYLYEARKNLPIYYAALTEKLAVVLYQAGNKVSALRELEAARNQAKSEFLPESKKVLLRLGMLYSEIGRKDDAKTVLLEYLKLTSNLQDKISLADRKSAMELLKKL